jgi:hypothetical protein
MSVHNDATNRTWSKVLSVATSPAAPHLAGTDIIPLKNDRFSEFIGGDHLIAENFMTNRTIN